LLPRLEEYFWEAAGGQDQLGAGERSLVRGFERQAAGPIASVTLSVVQIVVQIKCCGFSELEEFSKAVQIGPDRGPDLLLQLSSIWTALQVVVIPAVVQISEVPNWLVLCISIPRSSGGLGVGHQGDVIYYLKMS
jgi:hypothetical protein